MKIELRRKSKGDGQDTMKSTKANPKPGLEPKIVMYKNEKNQKKKNRIIYKHKNQIIEFTLHTFTATQRNHKLMRHCNKKMADSLAFLAFRFEEIVLRRKSHFSNKYIFLLCAFLVVSRLSF